jgi:hypothetical protein
MVPHDEQIWPEGGGWRHGDCPGMGAFPSLAKINADFREAQGALDEIEKIAGEVTKKIKKRIEELEDE